MWKAFSRSVGQKSSERSLTHNAPYCPFCKLQGFTNPNKPHEKLESHDNMLTLIKHEGLYRRLDIICPPPDQWCVCW